MNCNNCNFNACSFLGVFISILFGALIGVLFAFGLIPNIVISAWIAFGISVLALIFLMLTVITAATNPSKALTRCLNNNTTCLLVAIFGTLIFTLVALSIVLTTTSILIIIIVAISAFFFTLLIIALIALIACIVCELNNHHDEHC